MLMQAEAEYRSPQRAPIPQLSVSPGRTASMAAAAAAAAEAAWHSQAVEFATPVKPAALCNVHTFVPH